MSWLAGIAGKAEDLLNKVDKSAAVALQKTQSPRSGRSRYPVSEFEDGKLNVSSYFSTAELNTPPRRSSSSSSSSASPLQPSNLTKADHTTKSPNSLQILSKKKQDDEEKLLEFLNSPSESKPKTRTPTKFDTSNLTSKQKSSSELPTTKVPQNSSKPTLEPIQDSSQETTEELGIGSHSNLEPNSNKDDSLLPSVDYTKADALPSINSDVKTSDQQMPDVINASGDKTEEGNVTTKKELQALNEKLAIAEQRLKNYESEMKRMQDRLESGNSQALSTDSVIRELKARESDLMNALDSKDSQLAVLRVRLQEADEELATKRRICEELRSENERLLSDQNSCSEIQSQTVENLRLKLEDAEHAVQVEKEHHQRALADSMARLAKMEEEKQVLMDNLGVLQRKLHDEKAFSKDLSSQIKATKSNLEAAQKELIEYKQKAQRILQSKDKLIAALKDTQSSTSPGGNEVGEQQFTFSNSLVLEEVHQERDLLREELQKANSVIENLQMELHEIEQHTQRETDVIQEHLRNLQEKLTHECQAKSKIEEEFAQQREELQFLREELLRTKNGLQARIRDREMEVEKLRKQLMSRSLATSNESELEARLHTLTESLIQKQTVVEALNTEKNSLVLQLERMEQRLKEAEVSAVAASQNHSTVVGMNAFSDSSSSSDQRYRRSTMFGEHPFDSNVTRKVKRAYGVLDAFSVRVGVFLRQYPVARLSVILYMFILHMWVMIVLLTYQPEVHPNRRR